MNLFDIVLLILLGLLVLFGLFKGMTRILIGIAALVAAFMLAAHFHQPLAGVLSFLDLSEDVLSLLSYLFIFGGTMLAGGLLGRLVRKVLKVAMLSWADRLAGAALGLVAAMLVASLVVLPLVAYSPWGTQTLKDSLLAPYVADVADFARLLVPDDLSLRYREQLEGLRDHWRERWMDHVESKEEQA